LRVALLVALVAVSSSVSEPDLSPRVQPQVIEDGHTRPRAVVVGKRDGLIYVAATTANAVYVLDPEQSAVRAVLPVGRFPDSLLALPDGRVAVVSRYEPRIDLIEGGRVTRVDVGPEAGHRGLAFDAKSGTFYLASPALGVIRVLDAQWREKQRIAGGLFPRSVLTAGGRLYATDFNGHTLTAWAIERDGRIGAQVAQTKFHAPPAEIIAGDGALYVLTHEDRDVDRREVTVWYLDSVLCELDPATLERRAPDRNLTEQPGGLLTAKLDGGAFDRGRLALAGGASDNVLLIEKGGVRSFRVGPNPQGVAFDARGRIWVANRLGDAVSRIDPASGEIREIAMGARTERKSLAELGEVLYYSRDLVPRNVADGPKSVYACSACHEEAHIDGRLHPAKRNRFRSMTKTDRGIATTPPYLSLGELKNLTEFADNIISSHAQGWETNKKFDQYEVRARTSTAGSRVLSALETRRAMAYYMATIPTEPNPLVTAGRLDEAAERGAKLFLAQCTRCHLAVGNVALGNRVPRERFVDGVLHGQVALAGGGLIDVGTPVLGEGGNNPPSLRGIWSTAPYFSDGSARTLAEVVARTDPDAPKVHAPANHSPLTRDEQQALVAFLHSL
jgi:DNA-binding beta-propeller fold protein YncE